MIIEDPTTGLRLPADAKGYNPDFPTSDFKVPLVDASGRAVLAQNTGARSPIPVFGTVGGQSIRFYSQRFYNEKKSNLNLSEDYDEVDMVEIANPSDKFCVVKKRVIEMESWQLKAWGHIYQAYKEGRSLGGTLIQDWEAINENQRSLLIHCGIKTVEQMDALTVDAMAKLGPEGEELKKKAQFHMKAKGDQKKAEDYQKEVDQLRHELERLSAKKEQEWEARFKAMQAEVMAATAATAAKTGKSLKITHAPIPEGSAT